MPVDYQNGQVYKVWSPLGSLINIGSTCQTLKERFRSHRAGYTAKKQHTVNIVFDAYGVENCYIELLEKCPCNSKKELAKYEGKHQRENIHICTNKAIADRTQKEYLVDTAPKWKQYRADNKEHIQALKKANYEKNKESIKQKARDHYNANKEKKIAYQKAYALEHADEIRIYKAAHHKAKQASK